MGIKTKDCEEKENSLKALESGLVPLLTRIGNYRIWRRRKNDKK